MKIISADDCVAWLSATWCEPFAWPAAVRLYPCTITFKLPIDTGRKTALARGLTSLLTRDAGLLWFTEWSVFPSSENMVLFQGYRRSLGEERPLSAAPGHLFGEGDLEAVECLVAMSLYFYWDLHGFAGDALWLHISHDEVIMAHARDRTILKPVAEFIRLYELERLSEA